METLSLRVLLSAVLLFSSCLVIVRGQICAPSGPPSFVSFPAGVGASLTNTTDVRVTWQWKRSEIQTNCYTYTYVRYQPQGGDVSSVWVKKSNATSADLTGLQCDTSYKISVAVIAYGHGSNRVNMESDPVSIHLSSSCGPPGTPSSIIAPMIGVAAVVLLMLVFVVVLVLMIRWHIQKTREISSHVQVELAAEHEPDCDSDSYEGSGEDVHNVYYKPMKFIKPVVEQYSKVIHACEGEHVILKVKVSGMPKPTITWFNSGRMVEYNYDINTEQDGSLTFMSVELKHTGTYHFTATNEGGKVEGTTELVVHAKSEWKELQSDPAVGSMKVGVNMFGDYVFSLHAENNAGFTSQFLALPTGESGHNVQIAWSVDNIHRNRSCDVVPYDDNRVALSPIADNVNLQHDYINASCISGYLRPKKYIATQGPLPTTLTDFWRLVWQEKVKVIVMLTKVVEQDQMKCEQYWPDQGQLEYVGPLRVTLVDQQVFADYIIRTLEVMYLEKDSCSSRQIIQFQFTAWPHYGVPEYAGALLTFLHQVNAQHTSSKGPLLVHCSAGAGRTGTLIAIDIALEQGARDGAVDIPSIVYKIRRQRMKMVWADYQYSFIHDAVLEYLMCRNTQIQPSDLRNAIKTLGQRGKQSGRTRFETQFHVLGQVSPKPTEAITATALRHPQKNRNSEFLPSDKWRVLLKIPDYINVEIPDYINVEIPDYINASFANGYKRHKGFIIAQAPLKATCQDFWKMIFERECGLIVMLSELVENGEEMCYQYWPGMKETLKYGEFSISILNETANQDGFVQRLFSIVNLKSGQEHKVTQLQLSNWTPEGLGTCPKTIVDVTDLLFAVQRRSANKPVIVHGSDTVSRCGVFCALINVIECCKTEGIVDVFHAVKALRIQKPGSVLTVEQYRFIFDLVLLFLDSSSTYSDLK